jgi:glycosyltransferase involved in cell wall biosynthesis
MGKPVITHKSGYSKELVEEPGAGLTVNVLDEKEYANALISLLTDKKAYDKLSQKAYAFAKEKLSIEAMVKGYISAYKRALDNSSI